MERMTIAKTETTTLGQRCELAAEGNALGRLPYQLHALKADTTGFIVAIDAEIFLGLR